jgi:hypothetical protein
MVDLNNVRSLFVSPELGSRFEAPDEKNRWDRPLIIARRKVKILFVRLRSDGVLLRLRLSLFLPCHCVTCCLAFAWSFPPPSPSFFSFIEFLPS